MKMMLKRAAFSALSLLGNVYQPGGFSILTYHSVDEESLPISMTAAWNTAGCCISMVQPLRYSHHRRRED